MSSGGDREGLSRFIDDDDDDVDFDDDDDYYDQEGRPACRGVREYFFLNYQCVPKHFSLYLLVFA